jgi:hypothetical protein
LHLLRPADTRPSTNKPERQLTCELRRPVPSPGPDARDSSRTSPLRSYLPIERSNGLARIRIGRIVRAVVKMRRERPPVNASAGRDRFTPLSTRSRPAHTKRSKFCWNVAAKNVHGSTALHIGLGRGASLEMIGLLLRPGTTPSKLYIPAAPRNTTTSAANS